jgi:hypothetical protein
MNRKSYNNYTVDFVPVNETRSVTFECNNITFVNKGSNNVTLQGLLTLLPNDSLTIPGYPGEMCVQAWDIVFSNINSNGNFLLVICKNYV